jgi:RNA polymerase sigma-70 factor (ECF subfamily)
MTKTFRRRAPAVLDLVDEQARDARGPASSSDAPPADPGGAGPEAFESFYRREYPRLLVLARALTGAAAAEDLAQEVMLVAYRRWSHIAFLASPAGYVRGICVHKGTSALRRLGSERRALQRYAARPVARMEPLPTDSERFWAEVRRLPRRQAQVTVLYYALDLPVSDVASILDCAEGTVKAHLSRARDGLATRLADSEETS